MRGEGNTGTAAASELYQQVETESFDLDISLDCLWIELCLKLHRIHKDVQN